jgi:hypothetical protein
LKKTKAKNVNNSVHKKESSVLLWKFPCKNETKTVKTSNLVIYITASAASTLLFWNRIVALQIRLCSYGALPLAFMVISSCKANHLIGGGLSSYNDESLLCPRRRPFPRPLAPILLEAVCNRCTTFPPVAR